MAGLFTGALASCVTDVVATRTPTLPVHCPATLAGFLPTPSSAGIGSERRLEAAEAHRSTPPQQRHPEGHALTKIVLKPGEPVDVAMRRFRRAILQNGLIVELKSRTAYEKPTTERKRKKKAAESRLRKRLRMQMLPKKMY